MKISGNYRKILETYLEWEGVTTPASGSFQEQSKPTPPIGVLDGGLSAAEAICTWESQGKGCAVDPSEASLLQRYIHGKSQRDWWTKEIGWWNKNASYIPEEFLGFIGPLPFIELFGCAPITRLVRYYHDNSYRLWEFNLDGLMLRKQTEWRMGYYERDERDTSIRNAWRMVKVKWIDPAFYRIKRSFSHGS